MRVLLGESIAVDAGDDLEGARLSLSHGFQGFLEVLSDQLAVACDVGVDVGEGPSVARQAEAGIEALDEIE